MEYTGGIIYDVVIQTCVEEFKKHADIPLRKVIVSSLHEKTTCRDVRNYFSAYGCIEECRMCINIWKIPCAFVTFEKEEDAIRALTDPEEQILHDQHLRVKPAVYHQQPENLRQLLLINEELDEIRNSPNIYISKCLPNDIDKPSIHILNDTCLIHILTFLPIMDKLRAGTVCKRWKILSQESWYAMKTLDFLTSTWGMSDKDIVSICVYELHGVLSRCGKFLKKINMPYLSTIPTIPYIFSPFLYKLSVIGALCPNITSINATGVVSTPLGIRILAETWPNLTIIIIRSWVKVRGMEIGLQMFFEKVENIEHFQLNDTRFSGECLSCLSQKTMHTLILDACKIHDIHLAAALRRLVNLRELRIIDCTSLNFHTISAINEYCINLILLELKFLYDVPMTEFSNTKLFNLEILNITYNYHLTDDLLYGIVKRCRKLKEINVEDCPVTPEGVENIQKDYDIPIKHKYMDRDMHNQY